MRQLNYQNRVLETLEHYLEALAAKKVKADEVEKIKAAKPDLPISSVDFSEAAWTVLKDANRLPLSRATVPFSPRQDGCGRIVPNITLKVPTGGGKTYLAVTAVSRIMSRYLGTGTGFVLWIVPNEAIYAQTIKNLKDRDHPYRQMLDRASANRTKIMEKETALKKPDVDSHLCLMVLMLQSGNRQNKGSLKMFQDRGDVHGFFPNEGDQEAQKRSMDATPNLDGYGDLYPMVKDSLGNALRLIRPIVVMDEGQKATSALAFDTLYGFNPIFVLELTATPKDVKATDYRPARNANLLVEVTGRELHREEMIKMPLNLDPRQGIDWKATLTASVEKLKELQSTATTYSGETGRNIRPILLVQVERTGKDQRDSDHIHSEDVKEWLLTSGFDDAEIAIKTAEKNDLKQPENLDLMSATNRVRVIITKAALQEGWDCPFAYVLCSLAANSNLSAMTQLVGRILRQPYAVKTGVASLDECHVVTHHANTSDVVKAIKNGLEKNGLSDLIVDVSGEASKTGDQPRKIKRRAQFEKLEIYLPKVLWVDGCEPRELDYETDLLSRIDWRGFDPAPLADKIPKNAKVAASQLHRIELTDDDAPVKGSIVAPSAEAFEFDPSYAVRVISDLVSNPFVARDIIHLMLTRLENRGFNAEKLGRLSGVIIDTLRKGLDEERSNRAEGLFQDEVKAERIQFRLRLDGRNWQLPKHTFTTLPKSSRVLTGETGEPVSNSLFAPFYESELNGEEQSVAVMLDGEGTISWWHRNVAQSQYGLQGWKRGRIYPDFIFASSSASGQRSIVALETKGDHLRNPDTDYKRELLETLSKNFKWDDFVPAGQLELENTGEMVKCILILMSDIPTELPKAF